MQGEGTQWRLGELQLHQTGRRRLGTRNSAASELADTEMSTSESRRGDATSGQSRKWIREWPPGEPGRSESGSDTAGERWAAGCPRKRKTLAFLLHFRNKRGAQTGVGERGRVPAPRRFLPAPPRPAPAVGFRALSGRLWLPHRAPRGPEVRCFPDSREGNRLRKAVLPPRPALGVRSRG